MASGDVKAELTKVRAFNCNVFDGVDDYIEVPHDNRQLGASLVNGFTISAWINPLTLGESGGGTIIDKSTAGNGAGGFTMFIVTVDHIRFIINNGTAINSANNSTLINGGWYHVLATVSSAQIANLYVGGAQSGTTDVNLVQTIASITTTNVLRIGNRSQTTDRTFKGSIRDVKMWNRVLTAAEIAEDYAGTTPMSGLLHWFKLGVDYADYGAVGVTATNSGSVPALVDDAVAAVVKAQRVASTDKWMIYRGQGGQVGTVNIE